MMLLFKNEKKISSFNSLFQQYLQTAFKHVCEHLDDDFIKPINLDRYELLRYGAKMQTACFFFLLPLSSTISTAITTNSTT